MTVPRIKADRLEIELRRLHGNVAAAARVFGVTRQAVWGYINKRPKFQAILEECRDIVVDNVESVLYNAALRSESWAVVFLLKNQGRHRGYQDKLSGTVNVNHTVNPWDALTAEVDCRDVIEEMIVAPVPDRHEVNGQANGQLS